MRIRTIKPEFWTNERLSECSEFAHMLAAALLNYADDEGYFNANLKLVKATLFPLREDSLSTHGALTELSRIGYITLYKSDDGRSYGKITKFTEHQKINRPNRSKIKDLCKFTEDSLSTHGALTEHSLTEQGTGNREQGTGNREQGTGKGCGETRNRKSSPSAPVFFIKLAEAYRPRSEPKFSDRLKRLWRECIPTDEEAELVAAYVTAVRTKQIPETDDLAKYCCRDIQTCLSKFGAQLTRAREWKTRIKTNPNESGYYSQMETNEKGELKW